MVRRRDTLPENVTYRDEGCCVDRQRRTVDCPLEVCIHEKGPMELIAARQEADRKRIAELRQTMTVAQVAAIIGCSRRRIFRLSTGGTT